MGRHLLQCFRLLLLIPALFVIIAVGSLCVGIVWAGIESLLEFMPYTQGGLQKTKHAQEVTAISQMQSFQQAIEMYTVDNGMPPTTKQGLDALVSEPTSSPRPHKWTKYLTDVNSVPKDPWGNDYVYQSSAPSGSSFVTCYGADGRPGGTNYDADYTIRGRAPLNGTSR